MQKNNDSFYDATKNQDLNDLNRDKRVTIRNKVLTTTQNTGRSANLLHECMHVIIRRISSVHTTYNNETCYVYSYLIPYHII